MENFFNKKKYHLKISLVKTEIQRMVINFSENVKFST